MQRRALYSHINLELHFTFLIVALSGNAWVLSASIETGLFSEHKVVNNFFKSELVCALVLASGPSIRNVIVQFMNRTQLSVCGEA